MAHLYESLAAELINQMERGLLKSGNRLPGVRQFAAQRGFSVATVISAYRLLENNGLIEARNRSGFYVKARRQNTPEPDSGPSKVSNPVVVSGQQMALALTKSASDPAVMQLGAAIPDKSFLPTHAIMRSMQRVIRTQSARINGYEMPPGAPELRRQIAVLLADLGGSVQPDDILITSGCQEALRLALRALTKPGDVVALESPAFYGALQVLDALRLEAIEIPTDPQRGMSLPALSLALEKWPIKAVISVPNVNNPLGFIMSDHDKIALVNLLAQHSVPLIEDDIFGDLAFSGPRPRPIKILCPDADVIYCSSVSKTLSPGLRVGWIVAGRYQSSVEYLKYVSNIATGSVAQLTAAQYLSTGGYERYLRGVRPKYQMAVERMAEAVAELFPEGTKISQPKGGFVLWLQLPSYVDSFALANLCLQRQISIAPGTIFSAVMKYRNCMRISCACVWDKKLERALLLVGEQAKRMADTR